MFKTPDLYGYFNMDFSPVRNLKLSFNGTFADLSARVAYNFKLGNSLSCELFLSCKNLTDAFQQDLDRGMMKDSKYIYGPAMPRTFYGGLSLDF